MIPQEILQQFDQPMVEDNDMSVMGSTLSANLRIQVRPYHRGTHQFYMRYDSSFEGRPIRQTCLHENQRMTRSWSVRAGGYLDWVDYPYSAEDYSRQLWLESGS